MQQGLLGDGWGSRKPSRRARPKKTGRTQYRRSAWEDYATATLYVEELFSDDPAPEEREKRVEILAQRYGARTPLSRAADYTPSSVDWVAFLQELGEKMWEESCAARGLRHAVHGIHAAGNLCRIRPWNPDTQRHASVKDGYAATPGEAKAKLIAWWRKRGLDISFDPPPWFKECLALAQRLQAHQSEAAGGKAWDVKPEADDDTPPTVGPLSEWLPGELEAFERWLAARTDGRS